MSIADLQLRPELFFHLHGTAGHNPSLPTINSFVGIYPEPIVAQPYLNTLEELVARELSGIPGLFCKHFFGGAALYLNAEICASLTPTGFAFKLGEERSSVLIASGKALPLRYLKKSPQKKGYVLFPAGSKLGRAAAARYLNESLPPASQ